MKKRSLEPVSTQLVRKSSSMQEALDPFSSLRKLLTTINHETTAILRLLNTGAATQSATPRHLENIEKAIRQLIESKSLDQMRNQALEALERAKVELPIT